MTMGEFVLEEYLQVLQNTKNIDDCLKVPIPEMDNDQNYVFVSYSHDDYKEVYYDLAHLYCKGVRFWYDKGLSAGEDWEREVQEHIQSPYCCGVIFYLSTNMFLSGSIFKEIEFVREKKRPNIILQKNYFCVNLQDNNISDMLFHVQGIQRSEGRTPLDTKKLNTLTATFSDDDTYIKYSSTYHTDELIEQIQKKFDVTNKGEGQARNLWALDNITDRRIAYYALTEKETDLIPLFKYLLADFKKTKDQRPWWLYAGGIAVGVAAVVIALHFLFEIPDVEWLATISEYKIQYMVLSGILMPWITAKIFWLFYISPVAKNREKGPIIKVIHCLAYILAVLLGAALAIVSGVLTMYLTNLIMSPLVDLFM